MFEVDVQLRGDTIVVSHFLPFLRVRGWLEHDNRRFRWRGGPPRDSALLDVVELIPADCLILLDPKETDPARASRLAQELARVLPDRGRFRVSTHLLDDLDQHRTVGFRTWRTIKDDRDLERVLRVGPLPDDGVSVRHTLLTEASVDGLHRVVDNVVAWTVNDVDRARRLRDLGVDGITTDSTEVIAAVAG